MENSHFVAHLKNKRVLNFNKQCKFIQTFGATTDILMFMTDENGQSLAMIPSNNILWIEAVRE